ncbi:MAG: hypothetical protein SGI83_19075 [Bacteroidota bacterium]|nr:hypothetical protein [Bacteroidota bacterium]
MKRVFIILLTISISIGLSAQVYKGATKNISIEEKLNELYCTGLFQSTDGVILDVASNSSARSYPNILDWLEGRVAGLQIYRSGSGTTVPIIRGGIAGIFLDENPISLNALSALNTNDIVIIKVIKTPFYGGFNGGNGAIAIYTAFDTRDEEEEEK